MREFTFDESLFLSDLKQLLQIKTVNGDCGAVTPVAPLGEGVYNAIEYMLNIGERYGFRTKNLDGYCGWIEMGQGDRMAAILVHLDTVSVETEGWVAPPFDGTVIDGKLYGRGTTDDKGPAMLALHAMKAVADSGIALDKRVRLILGGDEEGGGWRCMKRYKETEETPSCAFTPDAEYPTTFAEKGILRIRIHRELDASIHPISISCGKMYNVVPAHASAVVDGVTYEAEGVASHAMAPEKGVNALLALCETLRGKGVVHPFLDMTAIANTDGFGIGFSDEPSGKLTINPAIAMVDETLAELFCDIRIPVTIPLEQVLGGISAAVSPFGFAVENTGYTPPLYVKQDSPLVNTLQNIYAEFTGDKRPPNSTGGGTYARAFENAVAFGALFPGEEVTYHKTNEYWSVASIGRNFQIFANAIAAL